MVESILCVVEHLLWASVAGWAVYVAREWLLRDSSLSRDVTELKSQQAQQGLILRAVRTDVERMNSPGKRVNF